jgi:hypothetical protein
MSIRPVIGKYRNISVSERTLDRVGIVHVMVPSVSTSEGYANGLG